MNKAVKLYTTDDRILVHHLKNLLLSEGIDCYIKNDMIYALAGEVPVNEVLPEIWLTDKSCLRRAQEIIEDETRSNRAGISWHCRCGEVHDAQFTACWKCGADKPDDEHLASQ